MDRHPLQKNVSQLGRISNIFGGRFLTYHAQDLINIKLYRFTTILTKDYSRRAFTAKYLEDHNCIMAFCYTENYSFDHVWKKSCDKQERK